MFDFGELFARGREVEPLFLAVPVLEQAGGRLAEAAGDLGLLLVCLLDDQVEAASADEVVALAAGQDL